MVPARIGFIGMGQMATALALGFVRAGLAQAGEIVGSDPDARAREAFLRAVPDARVLNSNREVAASAGELLFLAVKPQQMSSVLSELRGAVPDKTLVVSIAAGVRLAALEDGLGVGPTSACPRLARVMPNTPCLVGESASAFCMSAGATEADRTQLKKLLESVGTAFEVDEKLLDAVTGLSGSGPAFVYVMIEALADGGVRMGLPREIAMSLAAQTVRGAATMVQRTGEHPAALKDRVASPGGTTIAGLEALEAGGLRAAVIAAVSAAARRSSELSSIK